MATEINAGRVAMVPKGEWSASTAYTRLDVVQHGGSAWVCIQDGTGQEPALGSTYWQLLAGGVDSSNYYTKSETNTKLGGKQDSLVSGQNIKTVNGQSVLGTGNLELGELFVVTMTQHNSVYTADKSVSEIYEASYTNGKPVIAIMRDINTPILILTDCDPDAGSYVFSAIESNIVTTLRWQRSDDYTYELETMVLQPHLVSGTNIKTVNNEILLGSGNVDIVGKSAYQSYVDTTTDSPVKTEAEWVASLKGEDGVDLGQVAIADNLTTDDATKVLSAKQGYILNNYIKPILGTERTGTEQLTPGTSIESRTINALTGNFATGTKYYVKVTKGTGDLTRWYAYGNRGGWSYVNFGAKTTFGDFVEIITTSDCVSIGFAIIGSDITTAGTIDWDVKIVSQVEQLDNQVTNLRQDVGEIETTIDNILPEAIADNLTTDDATKVLSAKQGYILNNYIKPILGTERTGTEQLTPGTSIESRTINALTGNFATGTKYYVKVTKGTGDLTRWYAYGNRGGWSYVNFGAKTTFGDFVEIITTSDCVSIGFAIIGSDITTAGTIDWDVKIVSQVEQLDNQVTNLRQDVGEIETTIDNILPESAKGQQSITSGTDFSKYNAITGTFQAGEKYKIKITLGTAVVTKFYAYCERKSPYKLQNLGDFNTFGEYVEATLTIDANKIGFYIFGTDITTSGSLDWEVVLLSQTEKNTNAIDALETRVGELETEIPPIDSVDRLEENSTEPLTLIPRTFSFASIFLKWGFIGDSLMSGEHNCSLNGTPTVVDLYDYSWGQALCRMFGTQGYNFSKGGWSAKTWCNDNTERGWDAAGTHNGASVNLQYAYAIAIGHNDYEHPEQYSGGIGNADTDIDFSDYTQNADTFAGWYAGIIQRVQSVQPKAKIFCVTHPTATSINTVIRAMASKFNNVFIVDLQQYAPAFSGEWSDRYRLVWHLNAAGYQWFAWLFAQYVDWIVRNNYDKFMDTGLIGTPYKQ